MGAAAGRVLMSCLWRTLAVGAVGRERSSAFLCVCMCACATSVARFFVTLCLERLCVEE